MSNLAVKDTHVLLDREKINHDFVQTMADKNDYAYAAISLFYAHVFEMEEEENILYTRQLQDDLACLSLNGIKGEFVGRMADKACRNDLQCFHIFTEAIVKMGLDIGVYFRLS
ncbi:hypothetical protein M3P05_15110 [Sansalvadorimonas sp. 2012CJ34-2]|uniref:Uncharacterized protein n=1 Tax=Parendozoicomonas callyspongiae TaxID=2942213 RepID=A0ABT0PIQ1_9GAMM|nr:hypothetical protein [Sansalvadorimonas sp. 2012CJ34-2]MCL6271254.1 hypothetical protein [Sansalvadorimonas sp. 2012CJ34-2]